MTDKELSDIAMEIAIQGLTTRSAQSLMRHVLDCRTQLRRVADERNENLHELRRESLQLVGASPWG